MSAEDTVVEEERPVSFDEVGRLLAASLLHVETQGAYTHVFRAGTRTVPGPGMDFEYNLNVDRDGLIAGVLRIAGPRAAAELIRDIIIAHLRTMETKRQLEELGNL